MADIFISYARADRERVRPLVEVLEAQGWSVWWDRELIPGSAYEQVIDEAISEAQAVIVAWSEESVRSEWVQAEAGDGLDRHILVPVMLDNVRVPISFRRKHAARLIGWPDRRDAEEVRNLIRGVEDCLEGRATSPAEIAQTPSRAPGRVPRWIWPSLAVGVAALVAIGIYQFSGSSQTPEPAGLALPGAEVPGVAVLPVATESAAVTDEQIQLGFEIAQALRQRADLRVLSGELVSPISGSNDPAAAGRRAGAQFLLSATISVRGAEQVLQLSLVDTLNGRPIKTEQFSLGNDVSDVAARAVRMVASALGLEASSSNGQLAVIPSDSYLAYLRAKAELRRSANGVKDLDSAVGMFEEVIAAEPRFGPAHSGLCELYIIDYRLTSNVDSFDRAEKHCNRALTLNPENVEVLSALGQLYRVSGLFDQALSNFERAAELKPFDASVMRGMAQVYDDMGMATKSEALLKRVIEVEPSYWLNHRLLGLLYYAVGRYADAAEAFQLESQLSPDKIGSMLNLGSALMLAGDFESAIDAWEILAADSGDAGAYSNLGSAKFFAGDFDGAAEMYERSLSLQPTVHEFWGNAAEAYYFAGSEEHREYFRQALALVDANLSINPDSYRLLSARAVYGAGLDQNDAALESLEQALSLRGDDPIVWYDAARVYARLNDDARAAESLRRALETGYPPALARADANFARFVSKISINGLAAGDHDPS